MASAKVEEIKLTTLPCNSNGQGQVSHSSNHSYNNETKTLAFKTYYYVHIFYE